MTEDVSRIGKRVTVGKEVRVSGSQCQVLNHTEGSCPSTFELSRPDCRVLVFESPVNPRPDNLRYNLLNASFFFYESI